MAYPRITGYPDYTRGGTFRYVPEIWSGKIVERLDYALFLNEICNNNYEGEIKGYGDTVIIRTEPIININAYKLGTNLQKQRPTSVATSLSIDKGYYFDYLVEDVLKAQADLKLLDIYADAATQQLKETIEQEFLQGAITDIPAANKGIAAGAKTGKYNLGTTSSAVQLTKLNIIEKIIDCQCTLLEQSVPGSDFLWMIIPPFTQGLIEKSDVKDASMMGDDETILRNGKIGKLGQFNIYVSNLLYSVTDGADTCYHILFGSKRALTYADQIVKNESNRSHDDFADEVRGLHVYGYKAVQPAAYGDLYVKF